MEQSANMNSDMNNYNNNNNGYNENIVEKKMLVNNNHTTTTIDSNNNNSNNTINSSISTIRVPVHVEICQKPSSSKSAETIKKAVYAFFVCKPLL